MLSLESLQNESVCSPILSETAAIFYIIVGKGQNMIKNKGTLNFTRRLRQQKY